MGDEIVHFVISTYVQHSSFRTSQLQPVVRSNRIELRPEPTFVYTIDTSEDSRGETQEEKGGEHGLG